MSRATTSDLRDFVETNIEDAKLIAHIDVASGFVDDLLVEKGMSDARLKHIEIYLSAHLVTLLDQDSGQLESKRIEQTEAKYVGEFGSGLALTAYGQTAMFLDTSGTLRALGGSSGNTFTAKFRTYGDNCQ